jgi:hypothetical protein
VFASVLSSLSRGAILLLPLRSLIQNIFSNNIFSTPIAPVFPSEHGNLKMSENGIWIIDMW